MFDKKEMVILRAALAMHHKQMVRQAGRPQPDAAAKAFREEAEVISRLYEKVGVELAKVK